MVWMEGLPLRQEEGFREARAGRSWQGFQSLPKEISRQKGQGWVSSAILPPAAETESVTVGWRQRVSVGVLWAPCPSGTHLTNLCDITVQLMFSSGIQGFLRGSWLGEPGPPPFPLLLLRTPEPTSGSAPCGSAAWRVLFWVLIQAASSCSVLSQKASIIPLISLPIPTPISHEKRLSNCPIQLSTVHCRQVQEGPRLLLEIALGFRLTEPLLAGIYPSFVFFCSLSYR
jgi:hypothetical protein